jgi:hypothetical protein
MQEYYSSFYKTLVLNVATISAIIVGIVSFLMRSFYENDGPNKVRSAMLTTLDKVDLIIIKVMDKIDTDVPDVEVAQ